MDVHFAQTGYPKKFIMVVQRAFSKLSTFKSIGKSGLSCQGKKRGKPSPVEWEGI
jgi:hypothetical protein